jgi:hypothetical protein
MLFSSNYGWYSYNQHREFHEDEVGKKKRGFAADAIGFVSDQHRK